MSPERSLIRYGRVRSGRGAGQIMTFCWHPECKPNEQARLISIDVTADAAALKGAAHLATHQPPEQAS
jgi:hypothetical protein